MTLTSCAELELEFLPSYLESIIDRLSSYHPKVERNAGSIRFEYPFGHARLEHGPGHLVLNAEAQDRTGLSRIKDLLAVAVELYAKAENPRIVWTGDLAGDTTVEQFRLMRVSGKSFVTPRMLRVRLEGSALERFELFGGMHIRMLFPTIDNPAPAWPVLGENGLPFYPDPGRKPASRAYTIRRLDSEAGWMEVDFVMHDDHGVASSWALAAEPGAQVGILGPIGRPVRKSSRLLIGADETGLPAVGRMLEAKTPNVTGQAFIEVDNSDEIQDLPASGFSVEWIIRATSGPRLAETICDQPWLQDADMFGWFAAESAEAKTVRNHWRVTQGLGRDCTLAAGYWQRGRAGTMAG